MTSPTEWPANLTSQQIAAEYAQELSNRLGASVNAGLLAQGWLSQWAGWTPYPGTHHHRHHHRRHRRHHPASQQQGQPQQQGKPQRPAPRQYLTTRGVTSAISSILTGVLSRLWAAAAAAGWASAVAVLGIGTLAGTGQAVTDIAALGGKRIGWILETRLKRLERVLMAALRDGVSVDELAAQISAILESLTSALLVTGTETQWAQQQAALAAYRAAGVKWLRWISMNDGRVCGNCLKNQAQGPVRLGKRFASGAKAPPQHPRCRCHLAASGPPPKKKGRRKR